MGERMTLEDEAIGLSKAMILLDKHGYINALDEEEDSHCDHLRQLALGFAENIRKMYLESCGNKSAPYRDESAYIGLNIDNKNNGL